VIEAAVATVMEVGYYKASSNEIARRAGVTWSSISNLFGSREQLMLEVLSDIGDQIEHHLTTSVVQGDSLEARLMAILDIFDSDGPLHHVQAQILLDLASNPNVPVEIGRAMRQRNAQKFQTTARTLLTQVVGDAELDDDVVMYVFGSLIGYLRFREITLVTTELGDDATQRALLTSGVATTLRAVLRSAGTGGSAMS
jgi:AcrR family transcriptional regulator